MVNVFLQTTIGTILTPDSCLITESAIGQNANLKDGQLERVPAQQTQWNAQPSPGANSKKHAPHTLCVIL